MSSMRRLLAPCAFCLLALLTEATAKLQEELRVGIFSESEPGGIPSGWETLRFPSVREETVLLSVSRRRGGSS